MLLQSQTRENGERREGREGTVAVAIDRDKASQRALKWAVENFVTRGQTLRLVHVIQRPSLNPNPNPVGADDTVAELLVLDNQTADFFLPFRCFCTRRQIQCEAVALEDQDIAKALVEYVTQCGIQTLLLGATSKTGLSRLFKATDIPGSVLKWAPDFCNVYIISKGKVAAARTATCPVPVIRGDGSPAQLRPQNFEAPSVISLSRENDGLFSDDEVGTVENDMAWASNSGSRASSADGSFLSFYENLHSTQSMEPYNNYTRSNASRTSLDSIHSTSKYPPPHLISTHANFTSNLSDDAEVTSSSLESVEHTNDEMRSLRIELKQTMDMYHAACREALAAKQKVMELQEWKRKEEERRIREGDHKETEASTSVSSVEEKRARRKAAIEAAEAAKKFVEFEVQKRLEAEERKRLLHAVDQSDLVVKYQSLFHILAVLFLFYFYFSL